MPAYPLNQTPDKAPPRTHMANQNPSADHASYPFRLIVHTHRRGIINLVIINQLIEFFPPP